MTGPQDHKYWHSRGYLPHFDAPDLVQGITFRLWDALPEDVINHLAAELTEETDSVKRARYEQYLNAGYGACYLANERIGNLVEQALFHFDGQRYRLIAWVIMPNHVHVLVEIKSGHPLHRVIHSWKSYTASQANKILGRSGPFWFVDYYDRYIRDELHLAHAIHYIHQNPVSAGLVDQPEQWPFSSARLLTVPE